MSAPPIRKLLVVNRSEIAIRIMRAATELGLRTVAIYSYEDRFSLHRFKADESYLVAEGKSPIDAYLDIPDILRIARESGADAVHPGYGFLSEKPEFVDACNEAGITFVGPSADTMRALGNKIAARELAERAGVPVMPASPLLPQGIEACRSHAQAIGYPVMLKASWGGGGRGMRVIESDDELEDQVTVARREAKAAFGSDEIYFEKLVRRAKHVEVQILGDHHGNLVHCFERDCTVQRRNQKVVERAPAPYLSAEQRQGLCESALKLGRTANYTKAGTVEFLLDSDTGEFYFIEVNPRIQVEHTVTEEVTGIDLVKAQLRIAQGGRIGDADSSGVPPQDQIELDGHAMQCRVTTEDPRNNFIPDYGRITAYRGATGFGIRLDGGTAYSGALISRFYDPLLEKVTAWSPRPEETVARMNRALSEFRIRGVNTNLVFLEAIINHPNFVRADYTTRFIDETPELFRFSGRRDRATRLLRFLGEVMVNGNSEVAGREKPKIHAQPRAPRISPESDMPEGSRDIFEALGPQKFADWMLEQDRLLMTDTSFRDAHQSLLATRFRTNDLLQIAPYYSRHLSGLFSIECWGGATFDVAMRFLKECPWERLTQIRAAAPNILTQMLLRASNAVGYTNYPDNVVNYFVQQAASNGVDVFRIFDSLNWSVNMRVAMDAVLDTGKLCEAAICYTGDIDSPKEDKYPLKYYVELAKELEAGGAHILGIKDMAGLLKPFAARRLVGALKNELTIPVHFHTHDTSGQAAASVLTAAEAGVDAADGAMDSVSGLTSQPNLGSIAAALRHQPRDTSLDSEAIRVASGYWESVRQLYKPFESEIRAGASDVYVHEMPGGQYTNLREQARSLGIDHRWKEVADTYHQVNELFGNIPKVTPSSKVVGDMALAMVTQDISAEDLKDPNKDVSVPDSVVSFFRGELGQPPGGFPAALQKKILRGEEPWTDRPGKSLPSTDLEAARQEAEKQVGRAITDAELASYLMYPKVFVDYALHRRDYGNVAVFATPVFFWGLASTMEEATVDIEAGKTLIIRWLANSEPDDDGMVQVFFELNGQPRTIRVPDRTVAPEGGHQRRKAEDTNPGHVAAPMPGQISTVSVNQGDQVEAGDVICFIEAMKLETGIHAEQAGVVSEVLVKSGAQVEARDLLAVIEASG